MLIVDSCCSTSNMFALLFVDQIQYEKCQYKFVTFQLIQITLIMKFDGKIHIVVWDCEIHWIYLCPYYRFSKRFRACIIYKNSYSNETIHSDVNNFNSGSFSNLWKKLGANFQNRMENCNLPNLIRMYE